MGVVPPQSNIKDLLPFHATESNQWVACVKVRQGSVCVSLSLSLSLSLFLSLSLSLSLVCGDVKLTSLLI